MPEQNHNKLNHFAGLLPAFGYNAEENETMTIHCIVKGDKFEAAKAATARKIPFAFHHEFRTRVSCETIGYVGDQFGPDIAKWFVEPDDGAPYPVGTLLHYSWQF